MKQLLQHNREKRPRVVGVPTPQMKGAGLIVDNRCSLISVGTERQMIELSQMSLVGKARQRPDLVKQVLAKAKSEGIAATYNKVMGRLKAPTPLGYSTAGKVTQVHSAVDKFAVGDRVACAGFGYASHAETIYVPANLSVKIPEGVSYEEASFVTLGAIALQGVRVADVRLGETVTVIGLGLLGQITCMLLEASGCRVIGIDIDKSKLALAEKCGAELALESDSATVQRVIDATSGQGCDTVIITAATESAGPVETAGEICREKGSVVVVGAVKMDVPRPAYYNKELQLKLSRSYGPGRYDYNYEEAGHDYPFGYVRWTENRNMESFLKLIANEKINVKQLITHRFDIADAERGYDLISGRTDETCMGVVLNYPESDSPEKAIPRPEKLTASDGSANRLKIGFVGAGNFAMGVLLPHIQAIKAYQRKALLSGSGVSATTAAERFDFERTVSTVEDILGDPRIGTVFVANRHDQHAELVIRSLENGKATFVEKPLCLTEEELERIIATYHKGAAPLMVGFNRRFAPNVAKIKESLKSVRHPLSMHYRINAGFIPSNTWLQDAESGGGRVIGEVCHFIDLLGFITESRPIKVYAESLSMPDGRYRNDDNLQITIKFENGSVGTINYVASGNSLVSKEYLEIFGGGTAIKMDDFKSLTIADEKGIHMNKKGAQDKGHYKMLERFSQTLDENDASPIPFEQLIDSTRATFAVLDSLSRGEARWMTE